MEIHKNIINNMEAIDKVIYFDNDQEFYDYAVIPELVPISYIDKSGIEKYYTDFNFTEPYTNAVNDGMIFIIKDEDSQIYKHGGVSYRTIFKEIPNLEPWFNELDD